MTAVELQSRERVVAVVGHIRSQDHVKCILNAKYSSTVYIVFSEIIIGFIREAMSRCCV